MFDFIKPDKVSLVESKDDYGRYTFAPLEPGFGITIGNMMRRVLLSSLSGYAITKIKISGIEHEFSTIEGVVEDVTEIILNLKKIRIKSKEKDEDSELIHLVINGSDVVTGKDINDKLNHFSVINQEQVVLTPTKSIKIEIDIEINKGRGYISSEEAKNIYPTDDINYIHLDSAFSPIKNVKFDVEDFRVEQKTDYEKLDFELFTDGTIDTEDAIKEASMILIDHMVLFSHKEIAPEVKQENKIGQFDERHSKTKQLLDKNLIDFDLSVRAINCLKSSNIKTVGELVTHKRSTLMRFRNFGKKSLVEIENLLESKGLSLGMDTSMYQSDKEKI